MTQHTIDAAPEGPLALVAEPDPDVIDHLASDPAVRVVLLVAETIVAPRRFMSAARAAARNKPVIVVNTTGGEGLHGAVIEAAFRRAGLLRAATLAEGRATAEALAAAPDDDHPARQAWRELQTTLMATPEAHTHPEPDLARARACFQAAQVQARERLSDAETRCVLEAYGVTPATLGAGDAWRAGAAIDPVFGPVLWCGREGQPPKAALPPLNRSLAGDLTGPGGSDALHDLLVALGRMLADLPHLAALELSATEAQIRVAPRPVAGAERFAILPYPAALARQHTWDGRTITVRPIRPEDEAQHRRFIERLSPEDVRMRVFYTRRSLSHGELARLTQIDYDREMAFIAEADGETLGTARAIADPDNADAEFGVVVRSDLKGRGLGLLLMERLLAYLRERGTARVHGLVLRENTGMQALARRLGFTTAPCDEPGVERWERTPP